jgi:hypothetical protein
MRKRKTFANLQLDFPVSACKNVVSAGRSAGIGMNEGDATVPRIYGPKRPLRGNRSFSGVALSIETLEIGCIA